MPETFLIMSAETGDQEAGTDEHDVRVAVEVAETLPAGRYLIYKFAGEVENEVVPEKTRSSFKSAITRPRRKDEGPAPAAPGGTAVAASGVE